MEEGVRELRWLSLLMEETLEWGTVSVSLTNELRL